MITWKSHLRHKYFREVYCKHRDSWHHYCAVNNLARCWENRQYKRSEFFDEFNKWCDYCMVNKIETPSQFYTSMKKCTVTPMKTDIESHRLSNEEVWSDYMKTYYRNGVFECK